MHKKILVYSFAFVAIVTMLLSPLFTEAAYAQTSGIVPHYYGPYPNYATSQLPTASGTTPASIVLTGFTVQNGGSDYTTPAVIITGGGGTGATATARVSNGVIRDVVLTNPGTGYTTAPTVTVSDPNPRAAGASITATFTSVGGQTTYTGGIRKFIDSLPGLGPSNVNNLGQYIPVAVSDTTTFPGCDYYEIGLIEFKEKMHTDIAPTTLRGYVQLDTAQIPGAGIPLTYPNGAAIMINGVQARAVDNPHQLGPTIVATRDTPVRESNS